MTETCEISHSVSEVRLRDWSQWYQGHPALHDTALFAKQVVDPDAQASAAVVGCEWQFSGVRDRHRTHPKPA